MASFNQSFNVGSLGVHLFRDNIVLSGAQKGEDFIELRPHSNEEAKFMAMVFRKAAKHLEALGSSLPPDAEYQKTRKEFWEKLEAHYMLLKPHTSGSDVVEP